MYIIFLNAMKTWRNLADLVTLAKLHYLAQDFCRFLFFFCVEILGCILKSSQSKEASFHKELSGESAKMSCFLFVYVYMYIKIYMSAEERTC